MHIKRELALPQDWLKHNIIRNQNNIRHQQAKKHAAVIV